MGLFLPPPCYPTLIARTPATHSFVLSISTGTDLCKSSGSLPGRDGPGGKTADSGRLQILKDFLFKVVDLGRFRLRQARGRFGPFSDRPERGPRDDRNGGPGRESRETIRVPKSMRMSTTTSSMTTTTTTMLPTTSKSRQKIRGVHKSKWEFLSRLPGTKNFITRRPRKTSRHQGYGNSKTRFLKQLLETKNSFATREHEEKEQSTRSEHATTHMQRSAHRNLTKSVVFSGLLSNT